MIWWKITTFVITAFGFLGCVIFVTRYVVLSRGGWKDSDPGRFFVVVYTNLGALFLLIMTNQIFGDWPGRRIVSTILYLVFVIEAWWPLKLLTKARQAKDYNK